MPDINEEATNAVIEAAAEGGRYGYRQGFIDGLTAFAVWRDGVQWCGDPGMSLKEAKAGLEEIWNFNPDNGIPEEGAHPDTGPDSGDTNHV